MADFSAADVAALRKATGAGMMDCKKALAGERRRHGGGQGLAAHEGPRRRVASAPGRSADQGAVDVLVEGGVGAIVELTAETDFVAKGADFTGAVADARRARGAGGQGRSSPSIAYEGGTVGEHITQLAAQARRERRARPGRGLRVHRRRSSTATSTSRTTGASSACSSSSAASTRGDAKAQEVAHDLALHIALGRAAVPDPRRRPRRRRSRRSGRCSRS